jgi:hypothetical protein
MLEINRETERVSPTLYASSSPFNNNFSKPDPKDMGQVDKGKFLKSVTDFYEELVKEETLGNLPTVSKVMLQQSLNDILASSTFDELSDVLSSVFSRACQCSCINTPCDGWVRYHAQEPQGITSLRLCKVKAVHR